MSWSGVKRERLRDGLMVEVTHKNPNKEGVR
jgi:hypothetical protein